MQRRKPVCVCVARLTEKVVIIIKMLQLHSHLEWGFFLENIFMDAFKFSSVFLGAVAKISDNLKTLLNKNQNCLHGSLKTQTFVIWVSCLFLSQGVFKKKNKKNSGFC